ncbi:MAG: hypothetical protein JRN11_07750 [Nitrososphaerota archaeon]|nr:hypothetical protein [Nitrososphaerota archaeon]MDG6974009.1 hypothetical protein [Nitrososphaerota archaeon]MDG6987441.1 hypothetical protein [Nitrososphaerota archaeon]MDG7026625.1 hypothetical protein [Nitrososphaerota archaeon]
MSSKRSHRPARRRGLSEMIGALFILVLLVVSFGFTLVMFNSFTAYQSAVNTRAQYNAQLPREQLGVSRVVFGASEAYSPNPGFLGSLTSTGSAEFFPVSNMNFTSSSAGWTFTRVYLQSGVYGMSGNFDPVTGTGSPSGPGSIFTDFAYNPGSHNTVEAIGNWTAQFTLSAGQVSSLSSGQGVIEFSLGQFLAIDNQGSSSSPPTISVYLQDANTGKTVTVVAPTPATTVWSETYGIPFPAGAFSSSLAAQESFFTGSSGTYNFILEADETLKGQSSTLSEVRVNFDDSGVELVLGNYYSSTVCPTFTVKQNPLSIQDLTMSVTSSYTAPVTQTVYLWDFSQGTFTQVDLASVGSTATTRFIDLGGLVGGASEVQRFLQTATASVSPPGCPNDPISTTPGYAIMKIYAVAGASFTGDLSADVLTAYYTDTSHMSFALVNDGTSTIHLVSLWVVGSSGPTHYASTLPAPYNFSEWVPAGGSVSVAVAYDWTPGEYTIELVSALGNVFSVTATAS